MDNFYELFIRGKLNWSSRAVIVIITVLTVVTVSLIMLVGRGYKTENNKDDTHMEYSKICVRQAISIYFFIVLLCLIYSYCVFNRLPQDRQMYNLEPFWSWKRVLNILRDRDVDRLGVYSVLKEYANGGSMPGEIGVAGSPSYLLVEIVLNFMMLMPAGFLIPFIMPDRIVMGGRKYIGRKSINKNKSRQVLRQPCRTYISHPYFVIIVVSLISTFCISFSIELLQLFTRRGLFEWDDMIGNVVGGTVGGIVGMMVRRIWRKCREHIRQQGSS